MERAVICNTCFEEDNVEIPVKGYIDGEPFCQKHLAAVEPIAQRYGLTISDTDSEISKDAINATKNLPRIIPPIADATSLVGMIGNVIHGVLDGSYTDRQANAVSNLSLQALKAIELEWKMKRSKEVSFIVKQLEK